MTSPQRQRGDGRTQAPARGQASRRWRWYIIFIHATPTGNWAVEDEAEWGDETV